MSDYCSQAAKDCTNVHLSPLVVKIAAPVFVALVIALVLLVCCCIRRSSRSRISNITATTTTTTTAASAAASGLTSPNNVSLDRRLLASLPTFVYPTAAQGENLECAVCLMEFKKGEKGRLLPRCGHRFHTECVDMWLESHSTCPYCRAPVGSEDLEPPV